MFGGTVNLLEVYVQEQNGSMYANQVWKLSGNQGNIWKLAQVTIPPTLTKNFRVSRELVHIVVLKFDSRLQM